MYICNTKCVCIYLSLYIIKYAFKSKENETKKCNKPPCKTPCLKNLYIYKLHI